MTRAEELVDDLISHPEGSESDGRVNQLLAEYYRGAPLESLRILIRSQDERLQGEAAWIGSELPSAGHGLLDDIAKLLSSNATKARFFAVDCIQLWSVPSLDGGPLSSTVALIDDEERAVRWKVLCFLATADREQLQAAANFLQEHQLGSPYLPSLTWLLSEQSTAQHSIERIQSHDVYERRFAVVAAARLGDRKLLAIAAKSVDEEAAQFARDMLERISIGLAAEESLNQ